MRIDIQASKRTIGLRPTMEKAGIKFKKHGKTLMALCPFHADEKTPSLAVYDDNHFVCFGCGAKGDVITFIQKIYGLSFKEALAHLGIAKSTAPMIDWPEIRRHEQRKGLLKQFEVWRKTKIDELSLLIRVSHRLLRHIVDLESFDKNGFIYSTLTTWEWLLELLLYGTEDEMLDYYQAERATYWIEKKLNPSL